MNDVNYNYRGNATEKDKGTLKVYIVMTASSKYNGRVFPKAKFVHFRGRYYKVLHTVVHIPPKKKTVAWLIEQ